MPTQYGFPNCLRVLRAWQRVSTICIWAPHCCVPPTISCSNLTSWYLRPPFSPQQIAIHVSCTYCFGKFLSVMCWMDLWKGSLLVRLWTRMALVVCFKTSIQMPLLLETFLSGFLTHVKGTQSRRRRRNTHPLTTFLGCHGDCCRWSVEGANFRICSD